MGAREGRSEDMDSEARAPMRAAAVILNWNGGVLTEKAVLSVIDQVERVIVVDNASAPDERDRLSEFSARQGVVLIQNEENVGYAAGNNVGLRHAVDEGYDVV